MKKTLTQLCWLAACTLAQAQQVLTETLDKTLPLPANGLVTVENINGTLKIEGWDKAEVRVVAEKKMSANTGHTLDELEVEVNASSNAVFIDTEYPQWNGKPAGY